MSLWDIFCWGIVWVLALIGLSECIMFIYKKIFVSRNDCIDLLEISISIREEDDRLAYLIEYLEEILDDIPTKYGKIQFYIKCPSAGRQFCEEFVQLENQHNNIHLIT